MTTPWAAAFVALSIVTVALCILLLALARYVAALSSRLPDPLPLELSQGPEIGSYLDDATLPANFRTLLRPRSPSTRTLVAVLSTTCAPCVQLLPDLELLTTDDPALRVVAVVAGEAAVVDRIRRASRRVAPYHDETARVARALDIGTVPFALLYADRELVAKGVVNSRDMLENLLALKTRKGGDRVVGVGTRMGAGGEGPVAGAPA